MQDAQRDDEAKVLARPAIGPTLFVLGILGTSAYMINASFAFSRPAARLAPITFATATLALAVVVLLAEIKDLRVVAAGRRGVASEARPVTDDDFLGAADARMTAAEFRAFGWLGFAFLSFYFLGFLVGMAIFMVVMMRINGKETWLSTLTVAGTVMVVVHTAFIRFLGVRVYPGRLADVIPFLPT